jgi:hypothetical protein
MACKIEDIKEGMIKFLSPNNKNWKAGYDMLVKNGRIDDAVLTTYVRTNIKAKKAEALNARFDKILEGYVPKVTAKDKESGDRMPKSTNITDKKTNRVLEIGGLKIAYKVEEANKNRPLATTNSKTGEISIQEGITATTMAEYLSRGEKGDVSHTMSIRKKVLAILKKEYEVDFNDVINDLDKDKSNQLVRKFILLHEYRHIMQIKKNGDGFKAAYKADPVKFELDADLFALKSLGTQLPNVKPTKELKLEKELSTTEVEGKVRPELDKSPKIIKGNIYEISADTRLETANTEELIDMAEQKNKC